MKGRETRATARSGAHGAFFSATDTPGFCARHPLVIHSMPIPGGVLWQFCRGGDGMDRKAPPVP